MNWAQRRKDKMDKNLMSNIRENTERIRAEREALAAEQDASLAAKRLNAGTDVAPDDIYAKLTSPGTTRDPVDEPRFEHALPTTTEERKAIPMVTGLLDYFPAALAMVARVSKAGNDKHNPGEAMHWARSKSTDQADCIARHLMERGGTDPDTGLPSTAHMAWRALALLQLELEEAGAPRARGAR